LAAALLQLTNKARGGREIGDRGGFGHFEADGFGSDAAEFELSVRNCRKRSSPIEAPDRLIAH